jgi:hypothetical protein
VAPKSRSKLPIIIGAAVLALIIIGVGAAVLISRVAKSADSPADPGVPGGQAPVANKPSDAVQAYLEALAAGKADTALALGNTPAADKTFLTDAVLAESIKRAPITAIVVPEVTDEYAYSIDATYKLGSQPVSDKFSVTKAGSTWKVNKAYAELDISTLRSKTLPLAINQVPVTTDKIRLFPGSYAFTSGNSYVDYGKTNVLLLQSPTDYPRTSDVQPTLTAAGEKAFSDAVKAKAKSCLTSGELHPAGCPNGVKEASYQKIKKSSIRWSLDGDPTANLKPRLDYQNPAIAEANGSIDFTFKAQGTQFGDPTSFDNPVSSYATFKADMTKTPLTLVITQ